MKKVFFLFALVAITCSLKAQNKPGAAEQALTDSICNALNNVDYSKVTTQQDAVQIFTQCFLKYPSLLVSFAEEKHIEMSDQAAMRELGVQVGKNMMKQNCAGYMKISAKMAQGKVSNELSGALGGSTTSGKIKRIDNKGFNFLVIIDAESKERSFLWLRQFAGSEKLTGLPASYVGKNITIKWQEMEVYLPQAKGYYKVKEITGIEMR